MNVLTLVFSLLLILSYSFFASWDKQTTASHLKNSYIGHQKAQRALLNSYQSAIYQKLPGRSQVTEKEIEKRRSATKQIPPNRCCAKINLTPLINDGREKHPELYTLTAKLIGAFYSPLCSDKRFEYHFLDALLSAASKDSEISLEKLHIPKFERLYYSMLKGTKRSEIPPFLDYVKLEPEAKSLCLFHAHPNLLSILFTPEISTALYETVHKEKGPPLTQELIEKICAEHHLIALKAPFLSLFEYGRPHHPETTHTFLAKDHKTSVFLRKQIQM